MIKWLVLAAVLVGIAFGTHCPSGMAGEILKTLGITDIVAHMLMYGVLGSAIAFVGTRIGWIRTMFVLAVFLAMADEMTQPIFGREASFDDFLCDMVGLGVGGVCVLFARLVMKKMP